MESDSEQVERSLSRSFISSTFRTASGRPEKTWTPSWLSRSSRSRQDPTARSSRPVSWSTTSSSAISASVCSSIDTQASEHSNIYQLPATGSDKTRDRDPNKSTTFGSVDDATAALQSLAWSRPEDEDIPQEPPWPSPKSFDKDLPPLPGRSESRTRSTKSRISRLSFMQTNEASNQAEIELVARQYTGYWRPSLTANIPPAAAICGTMLLMTDIPPRRYQSSSITTNEDQTARAAALCGVLEEASTPQEALELLHKTDLPSVLLAVKLSFDAVEARYLVPDKVAWEMYRKIAEARSHPEKIVDLWSHLSKLLKKIPENVLVVMMFLLAIARRVQSRGLLVNQASPAVFLLQNVFPKYVAEDASRILLKNWDDMPAGLPQALESVTCKFGGRRCNVLALVTSKTDMPGPKRSGKSDVEETRSSHDRKVQW